MIKFVILEDKKHFQNIILNVIDKVVFKTNVDYKIEKYTGYNKVLEKTIHDTSMRKIYILDIELENSKSGLEIAKEIRKNDWDSEIIFITSHDRMFETTFRSIFKIFDFIEKFHNLEKRLAKNLKLILDQKTDFKMFIYENNKIKIQIYLKDILYVYRDTQERKLVIITTNNKFLVNMTIIEMLSNLDERFKQIHRACIVNTEKVNKYDWNEGCFTLNSGKKVSLCSKTFKENFNV